MKSNQPTIWKNSVFVLFSLVIRLVTNYIVFVFIAWSYGIKALGEFSLAFTVANLSLVLADFGFDVLLTTEIANNIAKSKDIIKKYFSMKIIFVGIGLIVMIIVPTVQNYSRNSSILIYTLAIYVVLTSFSNFLFAIFRGYEKFEYETKISFTTNTILLAFLVLFGIIMKSSLFVIMLIFIFAKTIGLLLSVKKTFSLLGHNIFKVHFDNWRTSIKKVLVFGLHYLFGNLFFKIDTLILGSLVGDSSVGLYQSAFKIMLLLLLFPEILRSSVLPVASRLFDRDQENWETINKLTSKILLLIALPITVTLFFFSEPIITLVYGSKYIEAVPILRVFSIILLIRFYVEPYGLMITTAHNQHIRMVIMIIATIIAYFLNYYLIPLYGVIGAAYASLAVNFLVGISYIAVNLKYFLKWILDLRTNIILLMAIILFVLQIFINMNDLFLICSILFLLGFTIIFGLSRVEKKVISRLVFKNTEAA